jgi:RND family efflux transporter MFP subunit
MKIERHQIDSRLLAIAVAAITAWTVQAHASDSTVVVQTTMVHHATIAQPVYAYGTVGSSASNISAVNLAYPARVGRILVQPGQRVTRGSPLLIVQADPAASLAAMQAASATDLARTELARTSSLLNEGLATRSQVAVAEKSLKDAQQAQAAQKKMGASTANSTITAPVDGVVLQVSVAQGDRVQTGAPLIQLAGDEGADRHAVNVVLGIDAADVGAIKKDDAVALSGLSATLSTQVATGHIVFAGAALDPQTQLVDIGANVTQDHTPFILGMRVRARISTNPGVHWIVPRSSVLKDDKGQYLFQISPDHKAHRVAVTTKVETKTRYGVDGPLDGAQALVVSGNYELTDGASVRIDNSGAQ